MVAKRNQLIKSCLLLHYHGFETPIDDIIKKAEAEVNEHKLTVTKFWFSTMPGIRDCINYGYTYGAVKYQADTFANEVRKLCCKYKIHMLD